MSDTPRTDAEAEIRCLPHCHSDQLSAVPADFARQLERDRAELLEALKAAVQIIGHPDDSFTKLCVALIAKAEKEPASEYRIKPEPFECWVVLTPSGTIVHAADEDDARTYAAGRHADEYRAVKLREVTE